MFFLTNAHRNFNYCIPWQCSRYTHLSRPLPLSAKGAGHETTERLVSTMNMSDLAKNWLQYAQNRVAWPTQVSQIVHFIVGHCSHAHRECPLCIMHCPFCSCTRLHGRVGKDCRHHIMDPSCTIMQMQGRRGVCALRARHGITRMRKFKFNQPYLSDKVANRQLLRYLLGYIHKFLYTFTDLQVSEKCSIEDLNFTIISSSITS